MSASAYRYSGVTMDASGSPVAGVAVYVYTASRIGRRLATLYTSVDRASVAANPAPSGTGGAFSFFAAAGTYQVVAIYAGGAVYQEISVELPEIIAKASGSSGVTDHALLSNIGTNSHAVIDSAISASGGHIAAAAPHSGHAASVHSHDNLHAHANSAQLALVSDGDHDVRSDNPHGVTATQVGLGNVPNADTTAAIAAAHSHANSAELALVSDGDHDAITGHFRQEAAAMLPASTLYICNALRNAALGTNQGAADRQDISPWMAPASWTCTSVGCSISTFVASALVRVVVFNADANGRPTTVFGTSGNIDASSNGTKVVAVSWSFVKGRQYWVGIWHSSTATIRIVNASASPLLSISNAATPAATTRLVRTGITFASANTNWSYAAAQHADAIGPPLILILAG